MPVAFVEVDGKLAITFPVTLGEIKKILPRKAIIAVVAATFSKLSFFFLPRRM